MKIFDPKLTGSIEVLNTITGDITLSGNLNVGGNLEGSITGSVTASYIDLSNVDGSASLASNIEFNSSSIASLELASSSYADSASFASERLLNTTDTFTGDLTVTGEVIAQTLNVQQVTSSIVYTSGSNLFGDSEDDTHVFTGKVGIGVTPTSVPLDISSSSGSLLRLYNTENTLYSEIILQSQDGSGYLWRAASGYEGSQGGASALNLYNVDGIVSIGTNNGPNTLNVSGSRVGIGVTTPSTRLDMVSTQGSGITMRYDTSTGYRALITPYWNSSTDTRIDFAINRISGETPDVIMSAGYNGNVGINTVTPGYRLDVNSGATNVAARFESTDGTAAIMLKDNTGNVELSATGNAFSVQPGGGLAAFTVGADNNATFQKVDDMRVSITDTGDSSTLVLRADATNEIYTNTNNDLQIYTNGNQNGQIYLKQSNGNVGIGETIPVYKLDVRNSGNLFYGQTDLTDDTSIFRLRANAGATDLFEVQADGNIGIGINNPGYKLDVQGDMLVTESTRLATSSNETVTIGNNRESQPSSSDTKLILRGKNLESGGTYYGDYGQLLFDTTSNYTGSSRKWLITNGYVANRFAIIRGGDGQATPTLGAGGGVNNGTVSFQIDDTGKVGIGASSPAVELDIYHSTDPQINLTIDTHGAAGKIKSDADGLHLYGNGSSDQIRFYTNDEEAVRINSSRNVGIGETNPTKRFHVKDEMGAPNGNFATNDNVLAIFQNTYTAPNAWAAIKLQSDEGSGFWFSDETGANYHGFISCRYTGDMDFHTGGDNTNYPDRRMRITGAGNLEFYGDQYIMEAAGPILTCNDTNTVSGLRINVLNGGTRLFRIEKNSADRVRVDPDGSSYNSTGTWGTITSDERLKENVLDATPKLNDILSLSVKNYNYIGDDKKQIGFIAQEFEQVFPSLVTVSDSRKYDEDGNVTSGFEDERGLKIGMDFAILVKAMQEQQAIIEDLKARLEALEG